MVQAFVILIAKLVSKLLKNQKCTSEALVQDYVVPAAVTETLRCTTVHRAINYSAAPQQKTFHI